MCTFIKHIDYFGYDYMMCYFVGVKGFTFLCVIVGWQKWLDMERNTYVIVHRVISPMWMVKLTHVWHLFLPYFVLCCVGNLQGLPLCRCLINLQGVGVWDALHCPLTKYQSREIVLLLMHFMSLRSCFWNYIVRSIPYVFFQSDSHLFEDLKVYRKVIYNGAHICTWPTSPCTLKPRCSYDYKKYFLDCYLVKGDLIIRYKGWFGSYALSRKVVMLLSLCMWTMMIVGTDMVIRDFCQKNYVSYVIIS
jgi:hypothetical protein